jgi:predicted SAM-dependent methyltransferase
MASAAISRLSRSPLVRAVAIPVVLGAAAIVARARRVNTPRRLRHYDKLHLGSGARLLDGWANLDINGRGTLVWDLRKPLPLETGKVRFVYTEHFIEHIKRDDAVRLFSHARRVMAPGGIVRVSTPDLGKLIEDYRAGRLVRMDHGGWFPETPCRMVNEAMHMWGHVFVYDQAELVDVLQECGFEGVRRVKWGESEHPELRNLESRPDFGDLILEARAS